MPIIKVVRTKVPLQAGEQRLIIATCEKGTVAEMDDMKEIKEELDLAKRNDPNFVDLAAHEAYFSFKDLDEIKPTGSVRIRVETIEYFLRRYREDIIKRGHAERQVEAQIAEYGRELRLSMSGIHGMPEARPELMHIASQ